MIDKNYIHHTPKACSLTELAIRYNPNVTVKTARRILHDWINFNPHLLHDLTESGWIPTHRMLTPAQIQMIEKHLGEP